MPAFLPASGKAVLSLRGILFSCTDAFHHMRIYQGKRQQRNTGLHVMLRQLERDLQLGAPFQPWRASKNGMQPRISPGLKLVTDIFYKAIILFHKFHPYSFLPTYSWWHPTKLAGLCQPPSPPLSATSWEQQLACNTEM